MTDLSSQVWCRACDLVSAGGKGCMTSAFSHQSKVLARFLFPVGSTSSSSCLSIPGMISSSIAIGMRLARGDFDLMKQVEFVAAAQAAIDMINAPIAADEEADGMDFFEWATAVDMELVPLFGAGAGGRLGGLGGGKGDGAGDGGGG
eukprot:CAMPEP_0184377436 /NCGR_PEP_ID=MMETSP0007-20130409/2260_1 /TAXON_ID=97485 /ORGANISM="Prymnesium parvum, Strain Texoma1" /LENGTH=146 /DNA_ID=CAMNT_0026721325 /DNA_START=393 /DNA_END=830 /DNA_ORIENTATION=+